MMIMFGSFLPSLLVGFSTTNFTRAWEPTLSWNQLHSSYERGCQEKRLVPAPRRDAGVVTYIQPSRSRKGDWFRPLWLAADCSGHAHPSCWSPLDRFMNHGVRRHSVPKLRKRRVS